jgi:predicted dehydrogenase
VSGMHVMCDKMSGLDIDYPDNFLVSLRHASGSKGLLCVDVVSRKPVRRLEVFSEDLQINWSGTPDSLTAYDIKTQESQPIQTYGQIEHNRNYSSNIIENAYADEIYTFFSVIRGEAMPRYTFEEDKKILHLIDRIEEQMP